MAILGKIAGCARQFRVKTEGVMAVEFALIAPVMIGMLFGMIELTDAIMAKRRVSMATSMLGDLATNRADDWIAKSEISDIFTVSERVLTPYGIDDVTVTITAVRWNPDLEKPVVVWSKKRRTVNGDVQNNGGEEGRAPGSVFEELRDQDFQVNKESLVIEGQNLIIAEMSYPFVSTLSNIMFDSFEIKVQEVRAPRKKAVLRFCRDDGPNDDGTVPNNKCVGNPTDPNKNVSTTKWDHLKCLPEDIDEPARC